MSAVKLFLVRCDYCGYVDESIDAETVAAARRRLREDGWTRPRAHAKTVLRTDACPACSEEPDVAALLQMAAKPKAGVR